MSAKLKVGIVGGTGMVGQRFVDLLDQHPWFEVTAISASANSAGKTYEESVQGRWKLAVPIPEAVKKIVVQDASQVEAFASQVDFIFCAVDMKRMRSKRSKRLMPKQEHLSYPTTPLTAGQQMYLW